MLAAVRIRSGERRWAQFALRPIPSAAATAARQIRQAWSCQPRSMSPPET